MNTLRYAERRQRLRTLLHAEALDAMLVSLDANRFYLSGFELIDHQVNESAGCLLITRDGKDCLFTDPRYETAAKCLWDARYIHIYTADAAALINAVARDRVSGTIGFEASVMPVRFFNALAKGLDLRPADGLVEQLRMIKEPEEIARLEAAAALNHKLMEWLPGEFSPGCTEQDIAWFVEQFFRQHGAESLAFPSITAIGANAALPHAIPGKKIIRENTCVLVDVGCRLNDYCSDQTRTFWVGDAPIPAFMETMALVRTAQEQALAVIRPGMMAREVYAAAYNHLAEHRVADRFTHGLGHGIGLQTHEPPSLNSRNDTILAPGMVITVEPGLYYPEWGGVRWEYMVLVTETGCRIL